MADFLWVSSSILSDGGVGEARSRPRVVVSGASSSSSSSSSRGSAPVIKTMVQILKTPASAARAQPVARQGGCCSVGASATTTTTTTCCSGHHGNGHSNGISSSNLNSNPNSGCCEDVGSEAPLTTKHLEDSLYYTTLIQGSIGLARICNGDVFTGIYAVLLSMVGFNARHPGPSSGWLKTYVLITFINGSMSSIDCIQHMLLGDYPMLLASLPLKVNMAHAIQVATPLVNFLGAYAGWESLQVQRRMQIQAYQQQMMAMMAEASQPFQQRASLLQMMSGRIAPGATGIPQPPPGLPPLIPPHLYVPQLPP
mmetsp:Transcript_83563/g.174798  ORF Transcript_83563/g.174798 Transcript_83563/m.174798 type:complete len:311 (-) Transcript_83563:107-1039(-)|eukprot:CAMPEP_0206469766 /NCGR_PEP_ID=MMETSP0324_2-20121206/30490_1 /ASSEMBLY_ACC=CAM_ASM_000836 /TAXON_ID=2866 /ORGANISM="Crypthecodinium cohnii, Strain Seligo" /LENGTH=310 /DNA_ID=CAMNT_0053943617 /DNA_START=102 /DNA_END=1034 /DNA_ORIENTATION=-